MRNSPSPPRTTSSTSSSTRVDKDIVAATTEYGVNIHASVEKDNVFACQFHPEKSGEVGLTILKNFAEL